MAYSSGAVKQRGDEAAVTDTYDLREDFGPEKNRNRHAERKSPKPFFAEHFDERSTRHHGTARIGYRIQNQDRRDGAPDIAFHAFPCGDHSR